MSFELEELCRPHLQEQSAWIEKVERSAASRSILSTLPYRKVPFWTRVTRTLAPRPNLLSRLTKRAGIPDVFLVFRLLARAHRYDLVLLAGGERADLIYAAVAGLCPWIRTPHVIVDAHWQRAGGTAHKLQKLLLRLARRLVVQVQPHSQEEGPLYQQIFGIPLDRLHAIPWSTSLLGYQLPAPVAEGDFILTGGFSFRDYNLFLEAAGRTGLPVKIGIPKSQVTAEFAARVARHPNITLHTDWSNEQYIHQMAACRVFAMPIEQGLTRSTADQSILNAMHFGKPVVATDSIGPRIYLRDGINGFLVHEATVDAWAEALKHAFELNEHARARIATEASFDARVRFNEPLRLARTLHAAIGSIDPSHELAGAPVTRSSCPR